MNGKISVFAICIEAIIYLLLYNLHDCTFKKRCSENMQELYRRTPMAKYDFNKVAKQLY